MNNLIDRGSHLFPSLPEVWYAIPLRLIVGYGLKIAFQTTLFPGYVQLAPPLLCYAIRIDDKPLTK